MRRIYLAFRAACVLWWREVIKYWRNKPRSVFTLIFPFVFLVVLGKGIEGSLGFSASVQGLTYTEFLFAGAVGATLLFTAMFSALSALEDRDKGSLRAVLIAPVPRVSILFGKVAGIGFYTSFVALLSFALLPLIGISWSVELLMLLPLVFLGSFTFTAFGMALATWLTSVNTFNSMMLLFALPMFILSGALFPLQNSPWWVELLSKINPATYGVDLLRHFSLGIFGVPEQVAETFTVTVGGVHIAWWHDIIILAVFSAVSLAVAAWNFERMR